MSLAVRAAHAKERRRRRSSRATTCGLCIATTCVLNCGMACVGWSAGWVHGAGGCTRTWAPGIGGAPRDAQAAVDVGATTFGIARSQDRGLGDSTVARAGFHSSISRTIYHAPAGRLVLSGSAGPEGPGRGRGWKFGWRTLVRRTGFKTRLRPLEGALEYATGETADLVSQLSLGFLPTGDRRVASNRSRGLDRFFRCLVYLRLHSIRARALARLHLLHRHLPSEGGRRLPLYGSTPSWAGARSMWVGTTL